jgi:myo-inositol 2-dehydrogenase / D-chiro-inositol 1-dehydrogenase
MRVGLLGAGWIAESHVPHIVSAADAELVAVCDIDAARARAIAEPLGAIVYNDWQAMLEMEALDALWVCTPPRHHRAPTVAALEHGIHVYLEKPIARDVPDAEAIVAAAQASPAVCAVGYMWRGSELLERTRQLLGSEAVALLVSRNYGPVAARPWFMDRAQSGGQILERASHHIDLQRAIAGEVAAVQASGGGVALAQAQLADSGIEDVLVLTLHFAGGAVGTFSGAWTADDQPHVHALDVLERRTTLTLDFGTGGHSLHGRAGDTELSETYGSPIARSVARFLEAAAAGDREGVFCTPADALGTLKVAVACETALAGGAGSTIGIV